MATPRHRRIPGLFCFPTGQVVTVGTGDVSSYRLIAVVCHQLVFFPPMCDYAIRVTRRREGGDW